MIEKITISEETQIERPASREMIPVEKCDWERIKRLINKIDTSSGRWENFGWFMSATSIAFLIACITQFSYIFLVSLFFSVVITFIAFFIAIKLNKTAKMSKGEVLL